MASIRIGIWARLLASNSRRCHTVEWNADHVVLRGWNAELELPYDQITDELLLVRGLLWNQLVISLNGQSPLVLGGISKRHAATIQNVANQRLVNHWKATFAATETTILACAHRWQELVGGAHYLRLSQLNAWLESTKSLEPILRHRRRAALLDAEAESAAVKISATLVDPEAQRFSYNARYTEAELEKHKAFLDSVETNPLSFAQRRACVQHDDANLVLAGAGTGKTSTMIGKAGYLLQSGQAEASEILMLAFGNNAAQEMEERAENRLGIRSLKIKTFHSLGLEIIGTAEGKRPSLSDLSEDDVKLTTFIAKAVKELLHDAAYRSTFISHFLYHLMPVKNLFEFKSMAQYIAYCKRHELRTLQGELVKSYEELSIANFLFRMGVSYEYEAEYKVDTATAQQRQYRPDFYLKDYDLYLEHFALNAHGMPPAFMNAREYLEGVTWKRALHQQHETRLLETFSHEQMSGVLLDRLEKKLKDAGVILKPLSDDKLLEKINGIPEANEFTRILADLIKAFKRAGWAIAQLLERATEVAQHAGMAVLIKLFQPVYERYQAYLAELRSIDFEDMINRAVEYVRDGTFRSPYRFILVDEFQDISAPRAELAKGLLRQHSANSLFCVGDDWQAIYRFTGSDISYTQKFSEHFGSTAINALETTYRFSDKIGDVASRFVQKNPSQIKKNIHSMRKVQHAAVTLVPAGDDGDGVEAALAAIAAEAEAGATVLLLARFKFRLPEDIDRLKASYPRLRLLPMTVHASKGKEADYVIVSGLDQGKFGFPSEKATPPLLEMLLPQSEQYAFAEERRLFYVALTRARHHVYLVSDPVNRSVFVRELLKYDPDVAQLSANGAESGEWAEGVPCPSCKVGHLATQPGRRGRVYVCSNRPYCEYVEQSCRRCGGRMSCDGDELVCQAAGCGERVMLCPLCGGALVRRRGATGAFWGCSNYRGDSPGSCRYTAQAVAARGSGNTGTGHNL